MAETNKNLKQKAVSEMRFLYCLIVGILLSLPVTAETESDIYDLQGRRKYHIEKGVNIIRRNDGNTKKVITKTHGDLK